MKFTREWVHLPSPLGYDPYDNVDGSYMVNTEVLEIQRFKDGVVNDHVESNKAAAVIAAAGLPEQWVKPFSLDEPLGDPL